MQILEPELVRLPSVPGLPPDAAAELLVGTEGALLLAGGGAGGAALLLTAWGGGLAIFSLGDGPGPGAVTVTTTVSAAQTVTTAETLAGPAKASEYNESANAFFIFYEV